MNVPRVCEAVGAVLLALIVVLSRHLWSSMTEQKFSSAYSFLLIGIIMVSVILLLCVLDIYRLGPYGNHTFTTISLSYSTITAFRLYSWWISRSFERASRNVRVTQTDVLLKILGDKQNTEYGKDHGFAGIKNVDEFRKKHPLTTYAHYEDYIQRTIRGEKNVIIDENVTFIALTSGTTGKNKAYPITASTRKSSLQAFAVIFYYSLRHFSSTGNGLRTRLSTRIPKHLPLSDTGIRMGAISAMSTFADRFGVTPLAAYDIYNENSMMYVHAVFALRDPELGHMELSFVSLARSLTLTIEGNWRQICDDIETGCITRDDIDPDIRQKLTSSMKPDPNRATELRNEFRKGFQDILPRVWTHLQSISMLTSGPLAASAKAWSRRYLGQVQVLSTVYGSTEGFFGFNMEPGKVHPNTYTTLVREIFFEFIPVSEANEENPITKLIEEVTIGEEYELVITTVNGLYRYRFGDVIKIVSFYNQIPQYEFCYRRGQMLNVYGERTTEGSFHSAMEECMSAIPDIHLVDYTSVENSHVDEIDGLREDNKMRWYITFIEVEQSYHLTDGDKGRLDESLCRQNEWYGSYRASDNISPITVIQVQRGTFHELKQKIFTDNPGASYAQFKMPRVMRKAHLLSFLVSKRCKSDEEGQPK